MKKFLLLIVVAGFAFAASAQSAAPAARQETSPGKAETKSMNWCPKCDHSSDKAGQCPVHKMDLVKDGMYYCSMHPAETSDKMGKCPKCGMDMMKMDSKRKNDDKMKREERMKKNKNMKKEEKKMEENK